MLSISDLYQLTWLERLLPAAPYLPYIFSCLVITLLVLGGALVPRA
jgi:hypothetical protein